MPRLIDPQDGDAFGLDDLVDALETAEFDIRDEDSFAALGPLLARLGRNTHFLADLAIDELKGRCVGQATGNAYGAQVFLLRPPRGRYVLRANFWPTRGDPVLDASGPAPFFYDMPHDHNFPFLTYGYFGPVIGATITSMTTPYSACLARTPGCASPDASGSNPICCGCIARTATCTSSCHPTVFRFRSTFSATIPSFRGAANIASISIAVRSPKD